MCVCVCVRLSDMQQLKQNLTRQANETHAAYLLVEKQNEEAKAILQNVTFTHPKQPKDINNNTVNATSAEQLSEADNEITPNAQLIQVYTQITLEGQNAWKTNLLITLMGMQNYELYMHAIWIRAL